MGSYSNENPNPKPHNRSHFNSVDKYKLLTFFLSLMEPFPRTIILQPVSCSNCLVVMPRGPKIRPTKLNCKWKSENLIQGHRWYLLINKRHGGLMLEQTIWLWNHTSHTKVHFNEFVANAYEVLEAVRGQKDPSEAKNGMEELMYWRKYLVKVSQQPQKPLAGPIRFELRPQVRKIQGPPRSLYK